MERAELDTFKLPDEPGIYIFKEGRKILYIGKAASLRDRTRSYFSKDLAESRSPAIVEMVKKANSISFTQTDSVLEALILEANEIKQNMPPYNSASKDNKSFNYLVLTKEDFPRVLIVRGRELYQNWDDAKIKSLFGPFPQGLSLQEAIKIVRKIFPFRDNKCTPCPEQKKQKKGEKFKSCKPCFNRQIGLCPGVCTGESSKEEYAQIVRHIQQLFSGNFQGLKRQLVKEMKAASKAEDFEKAEQLRRQCSALEHIKDVSLIKTERISAGGGARIEAFDVAHTSGQETVAVMTVVDNGAIYKAAYRKFKIQTVGNNDVAALTEALERRLNHPEWPLPRAFVVDGGTAQLRAAEKVLKKAGVMIPVVGVVKNDKHQPERLIGDTRAIEAYERDILLANNEAHRFGITWHRKRRSRRTFA
ncbi:MAG: UvrABC system protein [Candidatus Kaiserbacteria bacterium]|nr:UvrABC system protein [Candidatus Kaiserbacteria bacterium]